MKKTRLTCLVLSLILGIVSNVAANRRSDYFSFFGPDKREYVIVTSTSGIDGEDFLTVDISQFETFEEARNALFITFKEVLGGKNSETYFTEYSKKQNVRLNLSLKKSFMRTQQGRKIFADIAMFIRRYK
jgi:hypothetical protein